MILGAIYTKQDVPSTPEETLHMQRTPYHQAIGSLMYVAIATCPDITFTIAILSCFLNNPGDAHWDAVPLRGGVMICSRARSIHLIACI